MDYLKEIIKFNELLPQSRSLTASGIALWYGLMFIFHKAKYPEKMHLPIKEISRQTRLSKCTIIRERQRLCFLGLISYSLENGSVFGCYKMQSPSETMLSIFETKQSQNKTTKAQKATASHQNDTAWTQSDTEVLQSDTKQAQIDTAKKSPINNNIEYIDNRDIIDNTYIRNKENQKRKKKVSTAFKPDEWLSTLQEPWQGVMRQWLEYKAARKETYKTEVGARKCMTMLQNLAGGNPQVAQLIIDQSIGNNYAGLFALRQQQSTATRTQVPQTGQRIGQIKQPETEEKRQRLLERFAQASKKTDSENNQ